MMEFLGLGDLQPWLLLLVLLAGIAAGWIDAVVGGGGLLQLPVLLMVPGLSPLQAVATNKLGSVFGTSVSAATYARRIRLQPRQLFPMGLAALGGSVLGAQLAKVLPAELFTPIVIVALGAVLFVTISKPALGRGQHLRFHGRAHLWRALTLSAGVGFYDGLLGPGTGSFFVMALVGWLGYSFLNASARAKILNWATNIGALLIFIPTGAVHWGIGLTLAAGNMLGARMGAKTAISKGSGFIRWVMMIVVAALLITLSARYLRSL